MILRIFRFLVLAASFAALLVFGTPQTLISTKPVQLEKQLISAKDLEITCSGPAVIAGGASGTSVTEFKRVSKTTTSLSFAAAKDSKLLFRFYDLGHFLSWTIYPIGIA